jgi:hypothetical protein
MSSSQRPVPAQIDELMLSGRWPSTADEVLRQNLRPAVPLERIEAAAPGETGLYLLVPPFSTVAEEIATHESRFPQWNFWHEHGALSELDPDAAVIVGDFGPGSEAPIVLDYRSGPESPRVLRLQWHSEPNPDPAGSPRFIVDN